MLALARLNINGSNMTHPDKRIITKLRREK